MTRGELDDLVAKGISIGVENDCGFETILLIDRVVPAPK